ncbi:ATP-binding protein [Sphingomonas carotinifaciens]|uniref:ATP-binding protein n=1 Tax=Sphingomonas carotinifaciens TaxID=1166323 RepID=UPI0017D4F37D|nr:ATP-binding protein [Sphingomonas carotinifaciens]MBB4086960.1 signal transduction histidine kinase [Sphingomonas carotinifaciens]
MIVQFIGLVIGALIVAQLATLLLTLVIPPAPPREYALADIATALRSADAHDGRFDRLVQSGPPDLSARGWFVSETSRAKLAGLLKRPVAQVALGFYTQLPVGGSVDPVATPKELPSDAERARPPQTGSRRDTTRDMSFTSANRQERDLQPTVASAYADESMAAPAFAMPAVFEVGPPAGFMHTAMLQQMPGGPPGGGFPGGGPPGGGFPGAGLPGGGFPQSLPQPPRAQPQPSSPLPPAQPNAQPQPQLPVQAPTPSEGALSQPGSVINAQGGPGSPVPSLPANGAQPTPGGPSAAPGGFPGAILPQQPPAAVRLPLPALPLPERRPANEAPRGSVPPAEVQAARDPGAIAPAIPAEAVASPVMSGNPTDTGVGDAAPATGALNAAPSPMGRPVPIQRPRTSLFGLAPAPFVEGDFIAGFRLADGRWAVVSPRAEGFPNAWQRRVALWFLLSLLAVAPIAWAFARRVVGPLNDFAHAADVLGRDPGAAVLPLDGPAEIGRAAHAFNQMQSRLRSFVDDRTAMIGAISHDLRTPLTRLRFRIEDVPEDQQDDLRAEVVEMEEMITSVITFMRDASTPAARERRDLAEIVDDVIEDATLLGGVEAGRVDSAIVDVDPLGIRRVLNNLLTNALKYGGGHARVALHVENACAVAEIIDDGPGVPDSELERIFEPFYRSEAARQSGREGSGLGLAVCRSIARAHGGDVALFRSPEGFTARVTLPLAFSDDRRVA